MLERCSIHVPACIIHCVNSIAKEMPQNMTHTFCKILEIERGWCIKILVVMGKAALVY